MNQKLMNQVRKYVEQELKAMDTLIKICQAGDKDWDALGIELFNPFDELVIRDEQMMGIEEDLRDPDLTMKVHEMSTRVHYEVVG